ncbi:putative phosphatidylinositol kinase related protein [Leishmania major strain Friedlin]|uniref:non-specific serine/threonine protein kinase n=1 Tax=Leishmania major TaxID=5664 RepID=E9AC86_LEIMA|nr:putative phosphatidylinositol kinase related protein [Leishmania major strain Friedlin]CAG9567162.1 phosphatidylinositol_kinase_related_protein_-_putative [Leishmania major strain Friedlin]CBZ11901.1 putative phosphatidylinositol kinase related protein [Leishmania major strain Friedlin]|eukprot:XP_003721617.1 putative phosphatidylinositol kinase related protein [Leishmania major strain Friedlin]
MESFLANVDSAHLKARLNKIMADVNAVTSDAAAAVVSVKSSEEAGQCVLEFVKFFASVAEQHGTTPHAVLGQHVVSNVLIFVLERIVKPNLMTYCRVAERHAAIAVAASGDATSSARCPATKLGSGAASAATGRRDALEARRRRLRRDIIHPFTQLFQSLHTSLAEEGEPLMSWTTEGGGRTPGATRRAAALRAGGRHEELLASASPGDAPPKSSSAFGGSQTGEQCAGERRGRDDVWGTGDSAHEDGLLISGASDALSQAPLLWKSASPLNMLCNHILEVLESQWLVAVVGADYAALLIEVLRWSGYARLITPTYLVRLSACLVTLIQRVSTAEEADADTLTVAPNLVAQTVADGRLWVAAPCADDACLYAQVLMRLCALPQITTAYPPSSSTGTDAGMHGGGGAAAALAFVQRVIEVVKARHRAPTPDLRLEAYCIAALRQLCHRFRYDHPIAARAPVEVVKLVCDFFFLHHHTPRHDVWRLETMQFLTVVLSVALSDVVGEELWQDLHAHSRRAAADADAGAAMVSPDAREMIYTAKSSERADLVDRRGTTGAAAVANRLLQPPTRHLVVLLHQSVFPTMQLIFTQHRHEYSFTSRRELFSFPCSPLQEVFDFGAVVLYVTSITHSAYCRWKAAQENRCGGGGTTRCGTATHQEKEWAEDDEDEEQMQRRGAGTGARRACKRLRDTESGYGDAVDEVARDKAVDASDAARAPPPASPHPAQLLAGALQEEFFIPAGPLENCATAGRATTAGHNDQKRPPQSAATVTRRRAGGAPLVLRIGTSSIRASSAAVQDVVSDAALFLLHLFAQPCATLRVPETVADGLVEDVLLPLCGYFGLRLGQLLLAAVQAVMPRCSLATQQYAFAVVAQRALPTVPPVVARWAGCLDSVSSSRVPVARNDEDVLAPSEPVYHVLVVLLEQHLHRRHELRLSTATPDGAPRSGQSAGAVGSGQPDVSSGSLLSGLLLSWGDHHRALIQRGVARLHAWEQDMRRVCESAGATAVPAGVGSGAPDAPLPLLAASLALLLTRFAALVQCTRLWETTLCPSTAMPADPGTTEAEPPRRHVVDDDHTWGLSDGPAGDVGLSFLCHVAANATLFHGSVPVLTRASDGGRHTGDVAGGGVRVAGQAIGIGTDVLTVTSASPGARNALTGADTVALFSAAQFTAWLDLAETYACVALRMCLARQQVAEQTEMANSLRLGQVPELGGMPSLSTSSEAMAPHLQGPLRREVGAYVEHVCTLLDAAVTSPSSQVPAVLCDAADAHWMLRLPLRKGVDCTDVRNSSVAAEEVAAIGEDAKTDTDAAAFGTGVSPLQMAVPRRAAPQAFQVMLTLSAQASVAWLMRRAQLRHALAALTPAAVSRQEGYRRGGGGPPDTHTAVRTGLDASAMALTLSVQCVQLLHLLLRWRRAALWSPPEESAHARDGVDAAGERGAATAGVAKVTPFLRPAADGTHASAASGCAEGAAADFDVGEEASAAREDLRLLRTSPDLYAAPLSLLERFSAAGGGRLYYAVLWLCHHVAAELDQAHAVGVFFPLWTALHILFRDVGTVLLDPAFACVDSRHTIARFTAALTARIFEDGVRGLSRWRPSNPTSREVTHIMAVSLHTSVDTLRTVLWAISRTRIDAYVIEPLADTSAICRTIVALLRDQHLLDTAAADSCSTGDSARGSGEGDAAALGDILLPSHHRLLERLPFLPTILLALPPLLHLLALIGCLPPPPAKEDTGAAEGLLCCRAVVQVLQVLFVRYRYQLGPGLCSGFLCGTVADIRWLDVRRRPATLRDAGAQGSQGCSEAATFLYAHEGRLLERWTAQLTDPSRVDMPVCTPAWQRALLQAAFAVLPRCEPGVAEVLGRFSFEFLAEKTPYEVRHHAALQVGTLFRTFSARRTQVFHSLLTKAREGMLSSTETLCSTSLLALSEAVRAAPELLVDVLYTLLECWATRGFRHHPLVVACLERVSAWVLEGAGLAVALASGASLPRSLPYTHLCRMHVRPLLFKWLCEYRHPPAALPVECFGYPTQTAFVVQHLDVLSPLALLLLTEATEEQWSLVATRRGGGRCDAASAEGSLYERLVAAYADTLVAKAAKEGERAGEALGAARRRRRTEASGSDATAKQDEVPEAELQTDATAVSDAGVLHRLAPLCMLLAYFPGIVTQLLVLASHAPVSPFTGDAAGLADPGKERDSRERAGWPRRMGHADAAVEYRGSGGGHPSRASASDMTPTWAAVAQRCLYWLEAQFNTAEATMLAQSIGLVLTTGRRQVSGDSAQPTFSAAAARAVLCNPATASSAAEVLLYYLQHRSAWPHKRRAFDVVLAAQADAVMEALVVLHRTTAEVGTLVYGTPEQLQRALSWVAEKITSVPLPMPDLRDPRTQHASSAEGCGAATAEEETTQGLVPRCTSSDLAYWEAYCLALLVPPAAAPNGELHSPVTDMPSARQSVDAAALTEDVMTRFLLQGNSTYLYALLHAAYRSSAALPSLELQFRALQQLSLLAHIATCWCSARVLAEPQALRLVLSHLLHWLRRSPAAAVRQLVCNALLHVWQVARAGRGNVPRQRGRGPTPATQQRHCRLMLARSLAPLTAVSPLIAATWAALCRSDPDLKRSDWQQRILAYLADTESQRATRVVAATAAEGKERVLARGAISFDEPTDDEAERNEEGVARDGAPGASAGAGAVESEAAPGGCSLPLDGEQWTWAMYEAQRSACLAPLSSPRARGRLLGLQRLLRYVSRHDEEDSDEALEDVPGTVEEHGSNADLDELAPPESCAVSMQLIVEHASALPLPSAPLLQDITVAVDSAQALLVRCLHVASVCLRAGHVPPVAAGPTARCRSRVRTGGSLRPAEWSALDVRAVLLDTIQHLYRVCHCNMAALPTEYADAADRFRPLSPVYVADEDAHGVHATRLQMLSADAADEQLLSAFRLLRALALCVVLSGEAATLPPCAAAKSSAPSGMGSGSEWLRHEAQRSGASASTLLAASESGMADDSMPSNQTAEEMVAGMLAQAYAHQLRTLEQLVWCGDADASELGMCALRTWVLCIASSLDKKDGAELIRPAEPLSNFDEAVAQLVVSAWRQQLIMPSAATAAAAGARVGASGREQMPSPKARVRCCLQRHLAWVTRSGSCGSLACRRRTEGGTRGGAADTHLRSPSVWAPLRQCPPNQRAFLCRFVLAAANTYGILKKSLLWAALVPLLMAELRTAEGPTAVPTSSAGLPACDLDGVHAACNSAGSNVRIAEQLLLPVLLHALCLRESEGQRAVRQEWSRQLDRYVFQQAERCTHTTRLFLHVVEQCHAVLLRSTRQRGLKGATTASAGRAKPTASSSAASAAASSDGARAEAVLWPSTLGSVPSLQDMGECYWLSDIPAARLARAAVRVGEPHVALLFSQLSGESLYGPRTGAAALCGESETTQSAVMLRDGAGAGEAVLAVSSAPYSILFPFAKPGDYPSAASVTHAVGGGATRSGGRARDRHDAVRQQTRSFAEDIFDLYTSVQGQLELDDVVGVSLMIRLQSVTSAQPHGDGAKWCSLVGGGPALSASLLGSARSRSSGRAICRVASYRESGVMSATSLASGADDSLAAAPSAAAAWLDEMRLLEESETHHASGRLCGGDVPRAGAAADSGLGGATVEVARHSAALTGEVQERRPDPGTAHLQRAALLLQHGFSSTALDVLLSLHRTERRREAAVRHRSATVAAERGVTDDSVRACSAPERAAGRGAAVLGPEAFLTGATGEAIDAAAGDTDTLSSWTPAHEASLQALLAEATWKCGRWSCGGGVAGDCPGSCPSECVPRAVLDRLSLCGNTGRPESRGASLMPASAGRFYVHLLSAFITLTNEQPLLSMQYVRRAEWALRQQLSPTTFVTTIVAAEALNEVRDCAARFLAADAAAKKGETAKPSRGRGAAPQWTRGNRVVELPMWLQSLRDDSVARGSGRDAAELQTARVPSTVDYASRELLDSVRHALCQVYGDGEGWYQFVLGATEQALLNQDAAAAHRFLCDWKEQHVEGTAGEGEPASPSPAIGGTVVTEVRGRARQLDLVLRTAQIAYGLGRWQEALALLQPAAAAARGEARLAHCNVALPRTAPWHAPQEPRVIQQLMVWHRELRLLPPSQLVRDPFLSRAAASDSSGACSFLLARLCHTLAEDIAARLTSHEHRQLCESVEESKRLKADLEAQLEAATQPSTGRAAAPLHRPPSVAELDATTGATTAAVPPALVKSAGVAPLRETRGRSAVADAAAEAAVGAAPTVILSEDQLRVIRRRIRELAGDIKRLEDEWQSEKSNFGLYRRSAINAYSRFLQFNQVAQQGAARGVTEHTHRGAAARSEVKCLPVDHEEDVVHAVFGFVELWVNAADMEQGGGEVLSRVLDKAVERIPTAVFVPLAGQLTAQLGDHREGERLAFLVARLARDYPMHVVWPLLALYHGHTFGKSRDVNTLHNVDEAKITAARQLLAGLASAQSTASALSRAGHSTSTAALLPTQIRHAQLLSSAYLELALDRSAATAQVGKRHAICKDFMLIKDACHLAIPPPCSVDPFVTPAVAGGATLAVPRVMRYRDYFTTPGGVNVPKVLQCELSDGTVVRQLLKAGDDLRQDALIEQVFATANRLFRRRSATRPLQIRTFTIVPLAPTAGILQWVEHTIPLGEYLTGRYTGKEEVPGAHERYFPGEPNTRECRIQLQNAPQSSKCQVLLSLYEKFTPALHYFFLEEYLSAQVWVDRQQTFTRSVAASSIVGYTVGLGDRHINNILLHKGTAEVVHIDLGIAFDQNKLLPVPELVPFRLTRNMIDGLGVRGTEGSLRPCAEAAMHLLRGKRELIRTILSSIMHDPLARWAIGSPTHANHIMGAGAGDMPQESNTRQPAPVRTHGSSADAARTLARIDAKLRGYDGGDMLSVPTHVRKLMEDAQRVESLAVMFPGWSQWV